LLVQRQSLILNAVELQEGRVHTMYDQKMAFQVGDQVIHCAYGLGEIIQLDEKELFGRTSKYYVVKIRDLTIWVPMSEMGERCLRFLTPAEDFKKLFDILSSPGEPLSADRLERKNQLMEQLKDGTLESVCRVVRDLAFHKRMKKTNENDSAVLSRARSFLLDEWSVVLSVPIYEAENDLRELLGGDDVFAQKS
jgi:RNA polymerase-interacting CarD/CdnL/TRCF family regulator